MTDEMGEVSVEHGAYRAKDSSLFFFKFFWSSQKDPKRSKYK